MAGGALAPEFLRRIDRRVDQPPEPRLDGPQRRGQFGEGRVADHEQVDVAVAPVLAAREGAEHERGGQSSRQRRQRALQVVYQTRRLEDKGPELLVGGAAGVEPVKHLPPPRLADEESRAGECRHLPLDWPQRRPAEPGELAQVERLIRPGE